MQDSYNVVFIELSEGEKIGGYDKMFFSSLKLTFEKYTSCLCSLKRISYLCFKCMFEEKNLFYF